MRFKWLVIIAVVLLLSGCSARDNQAEQLLEQQRWEELLALTEDYLADRSVGDEVYYYKGKALVGLGDLDQALDSFRQFQAKDPKGASQKGVPGEMAQIYYAQGVALLDLNPDKASELLAKAVETKPEEAVYVQALAESYRKAGMSKVDGRDLMSYKKGLAEFQEAEKFDPENPEIIYALGWALYGQGEQEEALAYLKKAVESKPQLVNDLERQKLADIFYGRAKKLLEKYYSDQEVELDTVSDALQTVLAWDTNNADVYLDLISASLGEGNFENLTSYWSKLPADGDVDKQALYEHLQTVTNIKLPEQRLLTMVGSDESTGQVFLVWDPSGGRLLYRQSRKGEQEYRWLDLKKGTTEIFPAQSGAVDGPFYWAGNNLIYIFGKEALKVYDGTSGEMLNSYPVPNGMWNPILAPDLQHWAYLDEKGLWASDLEGQRYQLIAPSGGRDLGVQRPRNPQWSPDSSKIAYVQGLWEGSADVYVVEPGSKPQKIIDLPDSYQVQWSPDGRRFIISTAAYGPGPLSILLADNDGRDLRRLTPAWGLSDQAVWSPDGKWIAYSQSYQWERGNRAGLWVTDPEGKKRILVSARLGYYSSISWSPDGQRLAYVYRPVLNAGAQIWVADLGSSE